MVNERRTDTLSLDEVAARFAEAERLLLAVRDELKKLADLRVRQEKATESLSEASARIASFAIAAGERTGELAQAQRQVAEIMRAGAKVLDGTELKAIRGEIGALSETQRAAGEANGARLNVLEARIAALEEHVIETVSKRFDAVEREIGAVHERVKRSIFGRLF